MNESEALRLLRDGSEEALGWIVDRYTPYLSAIVYNIIGSTMSRSDVEEVVSDAFVALWNNSHKVDQEALKGWLAAVARNLARNRLRRAGAELPLEDDVLLEASRSPSDQAELRERDHAVYEAVNGMEAPDKEIFLRHYYYGQSVSFISEKMGMNVSTVKTRLRRGREKLRRSIENFF